MELRHLLESVLAEHVLKFSALKETYPGLPSEHCTYCEAEINGIAMSLRLLGGYCDTVFSLEWAKGIRPATLKWEEAIVMPLEYFCPFLTPMSRIFKRRN